MDNPEKVVKGVWRYERGKENLYIEEVQTTQWPKWKVQKDKKHTHKTAERVTQTPPKTGDELTCSGRVSCSCSTRDTRCVNLATNPVISHEWGKDREVFTTGGTYPWSFVTQIFHNGQPSHGGDRKTFEVMTSTLPRGTFGSVAFLLAATYGTQDEDKQAKTQHSKCWAPLYINKQKYRK